MESRKSEQCLYLDKFANIFNLEAEIVRLISNDFGDKLILEQFEDLEINKREATDVGYYCYFKYKENIKESKNNGFVGNVNLMLDNKNIGGAMIYLENGVLKMIECYFWEENDFFRNLLLCEE